MHGVQLVYPNTASATAMETSQCLFQGQYYANATLNHYISKKCSHCYFAVFPSHFREYYQVVRIFPVQCHPFFCCVI